jgi:hypothetical protein
MLPLLALAPYAPAAIAGIGALAKGLSGGRGQRIVQGGVNLANRGLTSLQPYTDALKSNFANKPMTTSLSTLFGLSEVADPKESTAAMMLDGLKKSAKYLAASKEERKQMIQNLYNYLGIDKEQALIDAGSELLENKELEKKKKGGYVKKQRKRKPYKSSAFTKVKKPKKRKYI